MAKRRGYEPRHRDDAPRHRAERRPMRVRPAALAVPLALFAVVAADGMAGAIAAAGEAPDATGEAAREPVVNSAKQVSVAADANSTEPRLADLLALEVSRPAPLKPVVTPTAKPTVAPEKKPTPTAGIGGVVEKVASGAEEAKAAAEAAATPEPPAAPDCAVLKCIALTFDDGPVPDTNRLLDVLAAKDAKATFFALGENVAAHPEIAKRIVDEGHILGNHTWDHRSMPSLTSTELDLELARTRDAITAATGTTPTLVRPPYGATNDSVQERITANGSATILWSVDTEDWKNRNVGITSQRALAGAAPGGIILMHDIHPTSVDSVGGIVDSLRAQGYTLVTIPELFGGPVPAGQKHFSQTQ